jgi:4-alpha-glucanotransferase
LIGDLPIFVAHDSADVWSRPDLFNLGEDGRPTMVAGVPPDYFSATGQRWGNPLYRWDRHRDEGYAWWAARLDGAFARFDLLRIDHFRGFSAYWEIPASEPTAINGRWVEGPGADLFMKLAADQQLPIIAEDLGIITTEVTALRRQFGFPGMRVAQFGFDAESDTSLHYPQNYPTDVVAYTGTHDNDTAIGWFWGDNERHDRRRLNRDRRRLLQTTGTRGEEINWEMIQLVFDSKAGAAIVPVQDVLGLGSDARMNTPGREEGNWTWRMSDDVPPQLVDRLAQATVTSNRI